MALLLALLAWFPLGVQTPARTEAAERRLAKLAYERAAFDSQIVPTTKADGYEKIWSMQGGQASIALYPAGESFQRYVIALTGGDDVYLLFQSKQGRAPKTRWLLDLTERRGAIPVRGTLRKLLWRMGYQIKSRRLTKDQRDHLSRNQVLASYAQEPIGERLWTQMIWKDGKESAFLVYSPSPKDLTPGFLPIRSEEASLLGLGKSRWQGKEKFRVDIYPARER